ncbi:hypothetical protein J1N35_036640 [Gossypium stocksii]|uniref:Uncharacterized protein n=1 Tax=Gossypium stocksii TaxID=47602 RepID=A0A9D3ZK53_9ROSI|nr:hypothetical protein J1N35_036640 [Gossypium stocksii]
MRFSIKLGNWEPYNIVFWTNCFPVNDVPLRRASESLECPKELESADKRSSVHVNLIKRNEKYPVSVFSIV